MAVDAHPHKTHTHTHTCIFILLSVRAEWLCCHITLVLLTLVTKQRVAVLGHSSTANSQTTIDYYHFNYFILFYLNDLHCHLERKKNIPEAVIIITEDFFIYLNPT